MPDAAAITRDNLCQLRERIARAAESASRSPEEITLVGVTKYVDAGTAALLVDAGCRDLGESRPQELWEKAARLSAARWHLVGHLQRNKIRRTLPVASLIHSVDSLRLLAAIDSAAAEMNRQIEVLVEVNCSGDPEKHGLAPDEVEQFLAAAPQFPQVRIRGLMTMAAREGGVDAAARDFAALRELRERMTRVAPREVALDELSMGMSGDFEEAIREGATIVRVGSLLWEGVDPSAGCE